MNRDKRIMWWYAGIIIFLAIACAVALWASASAQAPGGGKWAGNIIDRMTLTGNGSNAPSGDGGVGSQAVFPPGTPCTDCRIGNTTTGDGSGAQLQYRYVDRVLTDVPLLPWPMESRGIAELGVSITGIVQEANQ